MAEKLSSRERIRLALEHKETDRIPIAMLCGGINPKKEFDAYIQKERQLSADQYINEFLDIKELWHETGIDKKDTDIWGVKRQSVSYGAGYYEEIVNYPLASLQTLDEIQNYSWPTTKIFDYSLFPSAIKELNADRERSIALSLANPFETSWYMRGLEQFFMDMMMAPEIAHSIISHVTDYYINHFSNILKACKGSIDIVFTADDLGSQDGLLMPMDMWKEFIAPYHTRMNKVFHEFGCRIAYHSCGSIMEAVPGIMETGVDILQSIQLNAKNMDAEILKEKYGQKLCFEGAMCIQKVLPFGTKDEVVAEAKRLIDVLGKKGGYLMGPSHYIQHGTPAENIYAFFETARNYYPF